MTTDNHTTTPRFPVRPPAPGPAVVLDLPALWQAVREAMEGYGMTEIKQLSEITGVDRTSLGRIRRRAEAGDVHQGQRGGVNVNAYLTLAAFAAGTNMREFHSLLGAPFGTTSAWIKSEITKDATTGPTHQE